MKKIIFVLMSLPIFSSLSSQELNVMTFNIRYNNPGDSLNAWPYRKDKVASEILFHNIHVLGVQEALHLQIQELEQRLSGFRYIGTGRDDGKEKGSVRSARWKGPGPIGKLRSSGS